MHIHLDAVGGIAGDMFIASVLDAFPDLRDGMLNAIRSAGLPADIHVSIGEDSDHALTGLRFVVNQDHHEHAHQHMKFRDIRKLVESAPLENVVKDHAIGIFTRLAQAEAKVHGTSFRAISFHELGEWDSIADIVGAAFLISRLNARWTVSSLPQGSGRVRTAHGYLPIPAPATVLLLQGFKFHDDGIAGERVTPTGAAILNYLEANRLCDPNSKRLIRSGSGFGTKSLPGMSNVLRLLAFEAAEASTEADQIAEVAFEVDDQTPEDLAIGLDKLRAHPSVVDVLQAPVFAKKGRITISVRVLAEPNDLENVINACFAETTTLGVRYQIVDRRKLRRRHDAVEADGRMVRVKLAERPCGITIKAEADDLSKVIGDRSKREHVRRVAERAVGPNKEDEA
ncbi:MAG: DUF111 family protein [Burkholderiales bacterium]|nr:DUF111 family protein [Burkholderiales bacterium]